MTEKIFKYKADGRDYDIPKSRVNDFLDMYPNATVRANVDGRDYDIPHAKMPDFLKAYPNASYTLDSPLSTVVDTNYEPTLPESEEDAPGMSRRERRRARREERREARRNDDRPSWGESAVKGVGAGFTRTGKGLLDALHQLSAGMLYNDPETGEAKRLESYDTQMQDEANTFRNASVLASETAEELSREADPTGGEKGFVDLISEGKIGMALQKGLATGAESLPMTLSAYNPWTMALNAISMAGANYAEETLENPEIDPWKRAVKAIGSAAIEQAVEKFADPVFKYIGGGKGAGELTEEIAKELVEKGTKEATENIAKRIFRVLKNTAKDAAGEGVEEVVTSFGNDALGQALDWIDGDKDYGIRAQWEQMKEQNPDADLGDFAWSKGKEYIDSFIGGALSGAYMSGPTQIISEGAKFKYDRDARKILDESHAIGSSLDYGDMYDSDDTVREQIDAVAATFTNENGEAGISSEFIGTLSSEDAFALSRRNDFTTEQRNALFGLARAKAVQEGLTTKLDERLESQVNAERKLIEAATENGSIITAMHGGKPVYVMGAWNKGDGTVTAPGGQNGPVMVVDAMTGEKSYVRSEDIQFAENRDPADYAAEVETMLRENDARNRQVAQSTMSVRAKAKAVKPFAGKKILVDVGNGLTEVLVQQISPNGDVIIKGKKGDLGGQSIMTLSADVFYDSIYRDEDGNPVITEAPQEEVETPQEEAPMAETTGNDDYRGQTISILLNGVPTNVEVMSQDNPSDSIVYEYTDASGNRRTASSTIGAFNAAIQQAAEYVAPTETPAVEETPPVETAPTGSETQAPQEVPVTPENIDWDALFEQDQEAYFVELQNQFGEEALDILNEEVVAAQEELDSLSKKRGKTQNERLENRQKKVALQGRIDTLNGMIARLAPAAAPVSETPVTPETAEMPVSETPATETPAEVAPTEQPTATPETAPAVAETTPVTETPAVPESTEPAPVEQAPVAEAPAETVAEPEPAPVTTESTPVAPNPVDNPAREAQKREKALAQQLQRYGISPEQKSDMAFNAGKAVGDFFATREEYDAYAENATDLGDYNEDFERGVEASFANRQQNVGNSPVNSVPLETEPNGENNGEEGTSQGTIREGQAGVPGSEQTYDEGAEEGASSPQGVRGSGVDNSGLIEDRYPARKGDITRQELAEAFGLNSVSPAINQEVLNSVYDFMMEMSKMLGISPKSIGHGATLGVKTLKDNSRARAQYSFKQRIDGTIVDAYLNFKNSKLSSIAHEWFHSLDQALSYYETGKGKRSATNAIAGEFAGRKETLDAIKGLINAIKGLINAINKSGHKERLKKELWFDKTFLKYSLRKDEMTARAFEEYIRMKFAEAGIEVDGLSENATNHPTPEEMAVIAPAFDNLFKVLQEKEGKTPGTSVLYHIGEMMEEDSDARQLATEAVLTALDDNGINVVRATDDQTQQMLDASGANAEFMVSPDNPTFVSNAARAVEAIKMEKATPAQWLKMIEKNGGLKAGEDKWMGLSDWLKASKAKTLTKAEVLDFINENMIIIEEQHYSNEEMGKASVKILNEKYQGWEDAFSFEWDGYMEEPGADISDYEAAVELYNKHHDDKVSLDEDGEFENMQTYEKVRQFGVELSEIYHGSKSEVRPIDGKREQYTTQGLQHLREIALTVPTIESWNESDDIHFGDAGDGRAVAWVRFGETEVPTGEYATLLNEVNRLKEVARELYEEFGGRTNEIAEIEERRKELEYEMRNYENPGKKVLVIDEIQSKRHQEGREKGYKSSSAKKLKAEANELEKQLAALEDNLRKKYGIRGAYSTYELLPVIERRGSKEDYDGYAALIRAKNAKWAEYDEETKGIAHDAPYDAPFEKNWHELAMKRMLRYAAEEGYDVIAWTKGEQQAERYNIGGVLEAIQHYENENGRVVIVKPYNNESSRFVVNNEGLIIDSRGPLSGEARTLSDVVGKELAVRIMSGEGEEIEKREGSTYYPAKMIKGDGIRIGGEGMKGFYDKMLPAFMNKYGKKWGIKVADITLANVEEAGRVMHSVPVTDAMKESVMEGQPMFMKRPNGTVYGWTDGKKIYLTKAGINPNTPVHEYTHLWAKAMMQKNPKGWNSIKKLLKDTPVWNEVMSDPNYSSIHNDEDAVASEALSRISGKENAAKMEQMAQKMIDEAKGTARKLEARGLVQNMRDALNRFWEFVWKDLFKMGRFISVEHVTDRILFDLLNGTDLGELQSGRKEFSFIGEKGAESIDNADETTVRLDNLATAREMEESGKDAKAIKMATGWERGADGKWRYEISDKDFRFKETWREARTLGDAIEHDELFAAYPHLKDLRLSYKVIPKYANEPVYAVLRPEGIWINPYPSKSKDYDLRAVLIHEIQHAIQNEEGFAKGGNPNMQDPRQAKAREENIAYFTQKIADDKAAAEELQKQKDELNEKISSWRARHGGNASFDEEYREYTAKLSDVSGKLDELNQSINHDEMLLTLSETSSTTLGDAGYRRLAGEVEARNAAARIPMSLSERLSTTAEETEDVAREDQYVLENLSEGQVQAQIVTDPDVIAELEASPKRTGYRNVVQNEDGTFSSPMAYWLQGTKEGAKSRVETAKFEMGKWEEAEEHPELVDEKGHVVLVKPNKSTVEVAYDPYIHNRLDPVNLQFKDAWKRDELVYVETVVPETDLESGYHADQALLPVGVHSWSNGDVMLSKYDKPVRIMPWEAVADAWVERLNGNGVHFDVVPPALRSLLVERGVEILPPHKGMGKDCNDAYEAWKKEQDDDGLLFRSSAISPEMDAEYLSAVERGDMETAQRMVLEAAKLAMPNTKVVDEDGNPKVVWRASRYGKRTDYTVFDSEKTGGRGFYFANKEAAEKWYGGENLRAFFLNITNPDISNDFNVLQAETKYSPDNDGVIFAPKGMDDISFEAKAFSSSQIKSAEPVTYDDNGNVIPLSERFNPENEDIRYRRGEINANFVEQFEFKQNNERHELEYSDEFRRLQEESSRMSGQLVSEKDEVQQAAIRGLVGGIGRTLQRELDRATSGRGNKLRTVVNESKGTSFDIIENVDGRLFHDIFEIVRAYLPNGELVDLHDNYDDAICYITSDGLAGFAVSSDGNLISVYSLYGKSKKGFLGAIKDLITEAGATHLDGYNSRLQPLAEIYSKVFGWKVASMMDYNMEYDHDNIAENHKMPQVAFMVNSEAEIPTRHFNEDQYDEAVEYQLEQVEISQRVDSQNAAIDNLAGEPRLRAIEHAVSKEAAKLGVNVTYASREDMPRGHKNDKGYYNTKTGEIVICTENASSIADAIQTILHEAVAHKGLRQLMGDRFNEFISRVYESLDAETKAKVDALAAASYNGNTDVAMEEYIASLAETTDFDNNSVWSKIKTIFEDIINAILGRNDIKIGDNELRYILRASYNNMVNPRSMESTRGWAQDQMMREEYAINEATPEILSRTGIDVDTASAETAKEVYSRTVQYKWQEMQRQFQDAMQPVRIAIDAIQQETGNIPIEDYENYLLVKNQASSRSRVEIDNFQRRYFSPVVEQVNKIIDQIMESRGWNVKDKSKRAEVYSEVKQYLIAKHGLERNELFRSTKGEDRDYSGLTALFGLEAEEYVDAERMAQELVDNFENEVSTDELWAKINAATNKTLRHSYECGLLSRSQYEQIRDMFEFYIPLRGFDETTAEDVYSYLRFESNSFSPAVKEAKGRTSIADDPLAYIMTMAESEITQGNNNRAKQALFNFLLNRASATGKQNTLMQVEDVWYVKSVDGSGVVTQQIAAPNHAAGETYEEFEARMQALEATGDAFKSKKGQVDVGMRFQVKRNQNAHYIYLKVNGVEKAIYINGDPKAADAVNGRYAEKPGALEGKMREINRLISSTFTNYSLEFTFRNYFRDMVYANINIGVKESNPAYRRRFRRNWAHNNMRSMIKMLKAYRAGEYEGRTDLNEDEAAFVEFMENGGQTGYTLINSVESRKKDLENAIKRMEKGIDKGGVRDSTVFRYTLGGIELLNEASELVTRFAAFKTSRDMGRSVLESVNDAKEITVNFNTKGAQDGKGWMGAAARWFGATKFFFNATVQGVQNAKAMADANKLKFGTVVGSLVATGFLMPVLQGMFTGLLGGDDDENWYWDIPQYDRQSAFCVVTGKGKYVKIPLPVGLNKIYALGDVFASLLFDKKHTHNVMDVGKEMANLVAGTVLPVNPLEGTVNELSLMHSTINAIAPSSTQAVIQYLSNTDWKGAPIQKEYTYNRNDPQWMKAYNSNPAVLKALSKWCYENVKWDGWFRGWDWSPEHLDNTLSNFGGGIYSLIKKTGQAMSMIWNEEDRDISKIPVVGVLFGTVDDRFGYVNEAYYDLKEEFDSEVDPIKKTAKAFGYSLDEVFKPVAKGGKRVGDNQPKMQKDVYGNRHFEHMQAWYLGHKKLESINDKIEKQEKKMAKIENPPQGEIDKMTKLQIEYEITRAELVNGMLESKYEQIIDKFRK